MEPKKIISLLIFVSVAIPNLMQAQNVGIGTNTPDASAKVEIQSTSSGILIPRMTSTQRTAIASPATGLLVFDNDTGSFWFYNGTQWTELAATGFNTLDQAYDQGGPGVGRTIIADSGAVTVNGEDGFEVTGTYNSGDTIMTTSASSRLYFNPRKAAFRAGRMTFDYWDEANVGNYSVAMGFSNLASGTGTTALGGGTNATGSYSTSLGYSTTASGYASFAAGSNSQATNSNSVAIGYSTEAIGQYSISLGNNTSASGYNSFAIGHRTEANAYYSVAMGDSSEALGDYSVAMGDNTVASNAYSTVVGRYNDYTIGSYSMWTPSHDLFVVGNGTSETNRSNALVILKNGNTGIGTSNPTQPLHVVGDAIIGGGSSAYDANSEAITLEARSDIWYIGAQNETSAIATDFFIGQNSWEDGIFHIENGGDVGIGTTNPVSKIDVRGSALFNGYGANSDFRIESDNQPYMFFVDASMDNIGIGEFTPSAHLHIKQTKSNEEGLAIENDTDTDIWAWEVGVNDLNFYFNGTWIGYWDDATGSYNATSDRSLKKDITYYDHDLLPAVLQLRPASYRLANASAQSQKAIGFIAQDVKMVFPEIVREREDGKLSLNYEEFSVVAIKAIQEQQEFIKKLTQKNAELEYRIEKLERSRK